MPPTAISNPNPVYPSVASELGYSGSIIVQLNVDKKGKVSVVRAFGPIARCSNLNDKRLEAIRKAVVESAKSSVFILATENGKPVDTGIQLTYSFDERGKPVRPEEMGKIRDYGALQGRAKLLPPPYFPPEARANRISGGVKVSVLVDTDGKVIAAEAVSGQPVFAESGADAACRARFEPANLNGAPTNFTGIITYRFVI